MNLPFPHFTLGIRSHRLILGATIIGALVTLAYQSSAANGNKATGAPQSAAGQNHQATTARSRKRRKPKPVSQAGKPKPPTSPSAVAGYYVECLSLDADYNLWVGASNSLSTGLVLQPRLNDVQARVVPTTRIVSEIVFTTHDTGWMLANWADLYRTVDGGRNWQKMDLDLGPERPSLRTMSFSDPLHGWIGGFETILHTSDGGKTWRKQDSPADFDIRHIQFMNRFDGWATGLSLGDGLGLMLRTTDGGLRWKVLQKDFCPYGFTFVNTLEGWAFRDQILHTTDGGATWTVQGPNNSSLYSLFMLNNREGWASGDEAMLHTTDGGVNWTRINDDDLPFAARPLLFMDSQHGWAAKNIGGDLIRTADGGKTWQSLPNNWQLKIGSEVRSVAAIKK
jgi:photosystem II stability/assembly factor-like uncharacterized protein